MNSRIRFDRTPTSILMLGWELPPLISGGLGVACDGLLRGLCDTGGLNIDFLLPAPGVQPEHYPESVRIIGLPEGDHRTQSPTIAPNSYVAYRDKATRYSLAALRAVADIDDFDLVHAHDWLTFEAALAIKHATGKPFVAHIHSTEHDRAGHRGANPAISELERLGMQAADRIIAVSHYTQACLARDYGQPLAKIDVVYNGRYRTPPRRCTQRTEGYVSFIGRITRQKGPDVFVEAAQLIHARMPDVRFVMAGDGDLLPQMRSLVRALGLSDAFEFPGFINRDGVKQLLERSRVLVMPSLSEPFGLVGLEAIEAGVPVVLSRNCGLPERIPSAMSVDPEDVDSIAEATLALLHDPDYARRNAESALQEADGLGWDRSAAALRDVYARALGRPLAVQTVAAP
jgi:glycosyltransferase involved in cell wall biosynthesis